MRSNKVTEGDTGRNSYINLKISTEAGNSCLSSYRQETKTSIDSTKSSAKIIPKHPKTVKVNLAHDQKKKEKELAQKRQFEKV